MEKGTLSKSAAFLEPCREGGREGTQSVQTTKQNWGCHHCLRCRDMTVHHLGECLAFVHTGSLQLPSERLPLTLHSPEDRGWA